jgi:putative hydrolase of the HAD superfamily
MVGVLFDLDGTLHDRIEGVRAFAKDQFSRLGIDIRQLDHYVARFLALDANGKVWKDEVYAQLVEEFQLKTGHVVDTLVTEYLMLYPRFAIEVKDATFVLQTLKACEVAIGIVKNGRSDLQQAVIKSLGFGAFVKTIVISEEVGFRKPQHQIFEIALEQLGTQASETTFVGDDLYADVGGALMAGLYPIAMHCREAPDGVICVNTMRDVLHAICTRYGLPEREG